MINLTTHFEPNTTSTPVNPLATRRALTEWDIRCIIRDYEGSAFDRKGYQAKGSYWLDKTAQRIHASQWDVLSNRKDYLKRDLKDRARQLYTSGQLDAHPATVDSKALVTLLETLKKIRVTSKRLSELGRKSDYYTQYTALVALTLTPCGIGQAHLNGWVFTDEDGNLGRSAVSPQINTPVGYTGSGWTFTVDLETLLKVFALDPNGQVLIEYRPLLNECLFKQGKNTTRLLVGSVNDLPYKL